MAGERVGHTLQATAVVNEAWMKMMGDDGRLNVPDIAQRGAFFAIAAGAMREILVDYARAHKTAKRGGGQIKVSIEEQDRAANPQAADVIAVNDALKQFKAVRPRAARVAELLFFAGCTIEETAAAIGVSPETVKNDWRFAKAWLKRELTDNG